MTFRSVDTLVPDIYRLVTSTFEPKKENVETLATELAEATSEFFSKDRNKPTLRFSNIGTPCNRKLWYLVNKPELGEELSGPTKLKFLIGTIWEHVLLFLAKEAGHEVTGVQGEVELEGIKGHRDAIIDGALVDVKTASFRSFFKFLQNGLKNDDPFGYIDQLNSYAQGSEKELEDKANIHFLAANKETGALCLDTYPRNGKDYSEVMKEKKAIVASKIIPPRGYEDIPEGKSGNMKLGTYCSFCEFKHTCWPGLRKFDYAKGSVYMSRVVKEPRVDQGF